MKQALPKELLQVNREIQIRIAQEVEKKFRHWIRMSDDEKQKALLKTVEKLQQEVATRELKLQSAIEALEKCICNEPISAEQFMSSVQRIAEQALINLEKPQEIATAKPQQGLPHLDPTSKEHQD